MIGGMDELTETELFEAISGLGNWQQDKHGKPLYLANESECLTCLKDMLIALKQDTVETGYLVHLKLGEKKVLTDHLLPLLTAYREDSQICSAVMKLLTHLTSRVNVQPSDTRRLLQYLQDYKEAFAKKDSFIIILGMLIDSLDEEDETQNVNRGVDKAVFQDVLTLVRNLICVPDPRVGEAGYTPMRRQLHLTYIRHFTNDGVLDFLLLFAETLESDQNIDQAWILVEILYHIVAQIDPEGILRSKKDKSKKVLSDLLNKDEAYSRLSRAASSRHARFGTVIQRRDAVGGATISASVSAVSQVSKGNRIWGQNFKNSVGSESKYNMLHDIFFVDLEEGSVREHNQLNPYLRAALESTQDFNESVLTNLSKFFVDFVQTAFSSLVSLLRGTLLASRLGAGGENASNRPYGRHTFLNFLTWILEFHRHHHFGMVAKAKENQDEAPIIDIAAVQGALDLDMIQFVTSRLREYGKECSIYSSMLVMVLRTLSQQVKTIDIVIDSKDSETRDCGEVLTTNIVKEDVMGHLAWIMKNYKSSAHDPRVLSYSVEVFHILGRLMKKVSERNSQRNGGKVEFQVERPFGMQLRRITTTLQAEIESLADAHVIENLFTLLEKYRRHSPALNSMLVHLIYSIIQTSASNIVVFFELSYFVRIHRVWSDPIVQDRNEGKKYKEMTELLRYILRQFFKCAERNKCVFVELLFRKTFEKQKDALLESKHSEFEAILENYEDEQYAQFLERMRQGQAFSAMREQRRQLEAGSLPWTEEEDRVLRDRYEVYADHPLCMELLAAELPEDSRRNARVVKKRLEELGLLISRAQRAAAEAEAENNKPSDDMEGSPTKKAKLSHDDKDGMDVDMSAGDDLETLEMDLERLLDAAMDSIPGEGTEPKKNSKTADVMPGEATEPKKSSKCADSMHEGEAESKKSSASSNQPAASTRTAVTADSQGEMQPDLDLESELAAILEESQMGSNSLDMNAASHAQASNMPNIGSVSSTISDAMKEVTATSDDLENQLDDMLNGQDHLQPSQSAPQPSQWSTTVEEELEAVINESYGLQAPPANDDCDGDEQQFWEDAVQAEQGNADVETPKKEKAVTSVGNGERCSQQSGRASNDSPSACLASQESTLEGALERIIDDALA